MLMGFKNSQVLGIIIRYLFPDNDALLTKTCRNTQCDTVA
jgi:hypothetical protein